MKELWESKKNTFVFMLKSIINFYEIQKKKNILKYENYILYLFFFYLKRITKLIN